MIVQLATGLRRWSRAGPVAVSALAFVLAFAPLGAWMRGDWAAGGEGAAWIGVCGQGVSLAAVWLNLQLLDLPGMILRWTAMLCAMMLPLLALPIEHIERTTFRRDLPRSVALFVAAYLVAWIPMAAVLMVAMMILRQVVARDLVFWVVAAGALTWSASPVAQWARNRAHRFLPLSVRGWAAWRDCLRFGFRTGTWCVAACWPWMLLCEAVAGSHLAALPLIALILVAERAMPPTPPRWQAPRLVSFLLVLRPYRDLGRA